MSEYIKVEDIKEAFTENIIVSSRETAEEIVRVISAIKHRIIDLPTIDIVRCKECDYWTYDDLYDEYICGNSEWTGVGVKADDFCSRGERRKDE